MLKNYKAEILATLYIAVPFLVTMVLYATDDKHTWNPIDLVVIYIMAVAVQSVVVYLWLAIRNYIDEHPY